MVAVFWCLAVDQTFKNEPNELLVDLALSIENRQAGPPLTVTCQKY